MGIGNRLQIDVFEMQMLILIVQVTTVRKLALRHKRCIRKIRGKIQKKSGISWPASGRGNLCSGCAAIQPQWWARQPVAAGCLRHLPAVWRSAAGSEPDKGHR